MRGFAVGSDGKVDGQWQTLDPNTVGDDVMCLVEIPAQYETVTHQVLKTPATVRKVEAPTEYATVTRQVVERAAETRKIEIPATFHNVRRQVIDQPATLRTIEVPAEHETLTRQVKVADARTEQRAILCETNATPAKIQEIQRALRQAGFDPGPIDGVIREQTMAAVHRYQQARNLPVDGYLNLETVKALGVAPQ